MAIEPRGSVEEIAAQVVQLPDGTDFTKGEVGALQGLLIGKPEERDPLKYAEIFWRAAESAAASPWMRFACRSEDINGRRRAKGANLPAIAEELGQFIRQASEELPMSNHKYLFLGGVLWNVAIVRRNLRRYREAAAAQRQSSAWYGLAVDVPNQLKGVFAAQVEEVTAAFVDGDSGAIRRSILALIAARDHVLFALPGYPGWMQQNAMIHIAWSLAMSAAAYPNLLDWRSYRDDFDAAKAGPLAQWAQALRLWDQYTEGRFAEIIEQVPVDMPSSSADNAALTVQIFKALAERKLGRSAEAESRLRAVAGHQGLDGGIPTAVAKQLLA